VKRRITIKIYAPWVVEFEIGAVECEIRRYRSDHGRPDRPSERFPVSVIQTLAGVLAAEKLVGELAGALRGLLLDSGNVLADTGPTTNSESQES